MAAPARRQPSEGRIERAAEARPDVRPSTNASAIAVALAGLSPFFALAPLMPALDTPRFASLLAACTALAVAWSLDRDAPSGERSPLTYPVLAAAGAIVLSALLSRSPAAALTFGAENSLLGAPSWIALLAVFFLSSRLALDGNTMRGLAVVGGAGALLGASAVVQVLSGNRVTALMGNGDYVAVVLVALLPVAVAVVRRHSSGRLPLVAAIIPFAAGAIASGSLTAVVVLAIEAVFMLPAAFAPPAKPAIAEGGRRLAGLLAAMTAAVGCLGVFALAFGPAQWAVRVRALLPEKGLDGRLEMWRAATAVIGRFPLLGSGPDGFAQASQHELSLRLVKLEGAQGIGVAVLMRDPHALVLLALASFGAIGTIVFGWLLVTWARTVRKADRDGGQDDVRTALAAGSVAFLLCMLAIPWTVRFAALPALLAGLAVTRPPSRPSAKRTGSGATGDGNGGARSGRWIATGATAVTCFALAASAFAGDAALGAAQRDNDYVAMSNHLRSAAWYQPTRPRLQYEVLYALGEGTCIGYGDIGSYRNAVGSASRAVLDNGAYVSGLAQAGLDYAAVSGIPPQEWVGDLVERAAVLAPNHPDVVLERAHLAVLQDRRGEARACLDLATSLGSASPRLALYEFLYADRVKDARRADTYRRQVESRTPWLRYLLK